jgi:hypothetical protein
LAKQKGTWLTKDEELHEAELLQRACYDALCRKKKKRKYSRAFQQIEFGYAGLDDYCRNLRRPGFWGGEVEMMVLTNMLHVPIYIYKPAAEMGGCEPSQAFSGIGVDSETKLTTALVYWSAVY